MGEIKERFDQIISSQIDALKNNVEFHYRLFNEFFATVKQDSDFKVVETFPEAKSCYVGFLFTYKDFEDYICEVIYNPGQANVRLRLCIIAKKDGMDFNYFAPTLNGEILKYYWINEFREGQTEESRLKEAITFTKETIEEHHKTKIRQEHDYLTDQEFRVKVQKLMHPTDDYLFVDPITCEQGNLWFYNKLVEKIKAHPKIWKWFFTV